MGSFQAGFQMGGSLANQAIRNAMEERELALREAADKRAEAESKQRLEEGGLRIAAQRRIDDATNALDVGTRLGIQNRDAIRANDADFDAAVEATGRGLPMPQAAPMQPEYRPATDLELNALQARLAAAKGDMPAMETLRGARKGLQFEEGYKTHAKAWDAMDDDAKNGLLKKLSLDANIPGYGTWVAGKGKQAGYMNYMAPGKDPVKLSANEARDLYVLSNLMEVDPMRARAEMDKVSDRVRNIAKDVFDAQTKGVTANNTAAHYANQDQLGAERNGLMRGHYADMGQYYKDRAVMDKMGAAEYFTGTDGNTYAMVPTMGRNGLTFQQVQVNPAGVGLKSMRGQGGKPTKIEEAGTRMMVDGKAVQSDGYGGFIDMKGVLPDDRTGFLKKAGVPDNLVEELPWSADGKSVGFRGRAYDVNNKGDMKALLDDYAKYSANDRQVEELIKNDPHAFPNRRNPLAFGPKPTFPNADPDAPSIYAGPEAWAAYRERQAKRRLGNQPQ